MTVLPYAQARQIVAATVPNHVVTVDGNRWYDYSAAVQEIRTAFHYPADGWMAPFIDGMVADAVEDAYGALLPDWQRRGQPNPDSASDYTYPGDEWMAPFIGGMVASAGDYTYPGDLED